MYASTNIQTILIDERYVKKPMTTWYHPNIGKKESLPIEILSHYMPNEGLEYVFSYWSNGNVNLLCNDWHHQLCPSRLD